MYPRVKVREEEKDEDRYEFEMRSLQYKKGFKFITLDDLSFPDNSPTCVVRVPKLSSSNSTTPVVSPLKGESRDTTTTTTTTTKPYSETDKEQIYSENNKSNIRASAVPRPRAVLSSPDNDGIITQKTKQGEDLLLSRSKKQDLSQNRHVHSKKPVPVHVTVKVRRDCASDDTRSKPRKVVVPDPNKRAHKSKPDKRKE